MDELPDAYKDWIEKNAQLFSSGTRIKTKKDALSGALNLGQLQARERQRGWQIVEPSGAKGGGEGGHAAEAAPSTAPPGLPDVSVPAGLSESEGFVYRAMANAAYKWRTVKGVARDTQLPQGTVEGDLERLVTLGHLRKQAPKTQGATVYAATGKLGS
jgi:hypothetical protein